jgi:hypothetical protein
VGWLVSESVRGLLRFSRCELFLLETGSWGTGTVREPRGRERPPLKPLPGSYCWRHNRLRRVSTCCSKLQSVWISDSAVVSCIILNDGSVEMIENVAVNEAALCSHGPSHFSDHVGAALNAVFRYKRIIGNGTLARSPSSSHSSVLHFWTRYNKNISGSEKVRDLNPVRGKTYAGNAHAPLEGSCILIRSVHSDARGAHKEIRLVAGKWNEIYVSFVCSNTFLITHLQRFYF